MAALEPAMARGIAALKAIVKRGVCVRAPHRNGRRFVIVHLDGVSRSRLVRGMEEGWLPNLKRLVERGAAAHSPLYAGSPSSTPAFQAGLLWGVRADVPGFLWYDKRLGRAVRMDRKLDATRVEDEIARGRRGLLEDGTSYFSLFSGGSCVNAWCLTGWARDQVRLHPGANGWDALSLLAVHAFTAANVGARGVIDGANAVADVIDWAGRTGRFDHEGPFLKNRVMLSAGARSYATAATVLDVARGVPSIYCCFADYDEIAHRRGPYSDEALRSLRSTDGSVGVVLDAVEAADNEYDVYVLADHGQVATRPFEQVAGQTLAELVNGKRAGLPVSSRSWPENLLRATWRAATHHDEPPAHMEVELLGALRRDGMHGSERVRVVDAGDVAHIYFNDSAEPMPLEEIQARHPAVLEAIVASPAAGVVAVRGGRAGFAWRGGARIDLADERGVERLGLGYGCQRTRDAIRGMLAMRSSGDIVIYGNGLHGSDVAYAWEFGSHGGIAQDEVEAFVIHPADAPFDFAAVEHASDLYRFFVRHYGIETEPEQRV